MTEQLELSCFLLQKPKENRLKIGTLGSVWCKLGGINKIRFIFYWVSNCKKPDDFWNKPQYVLINNKFSHGFVLLI